MAVITPAKSAKSPATSVYRVFLILTEPKYKAKTYKIVSEQAWNTQDKRPTNESAPKVFIESIIMALEPLPLNGCIRAVGSASVKSVFMPVKLKTHFRASTI